MPTQRLTEAATLPAITNGAGRECPRLRTGRPKPLVEQGLYIAEVVLRHGPLERHALAGPFLRARRDRPRRPRADARCCSRVAERRERGAEIVLRRCPLERHALADDRGCGRWPLPSQHVRLGKGRTIEVLHSTVAERVAVTVQCGTTTQVSVKHFGPFGEKALLHQVDHSLHRFPLIHRVGDHAFQPCR